MDNWSSYGYPPLPAVGMERDPWERQGREASALEVEESDASTAAMAASFET
jgi:hypothetical protein